MSNTTYIETELGLLPSDWKVVRIGNCLTIGNGRDYKHLPRGSVPVYGTGGLMAYVNDHLYEGATICIGRKGTIDKPQYHEGKIWTVDTLFYSHHFKEDTKYLYYTFCRIDWMSMNEATGVPSLTSKRIEDAFIPLPPTKAEQTAIAGALSDIDSLIRNFDRTIAKKQNIRQGAMEQLLSGQLRLPGFKKKWVDHRIGELAIVNSGGTPDSSNSEYYGGKIKFLSIGDMTNSGKYITSTEKSITESGLKNSSARLFPSGTLMYAIYASLGKCSISMTEMAISQAILGFKLSNKIDRDYLYYYFCSIENKVKTIGQTGTQANLSKSIVENLDIHIPTDIKEQQAIADTLTAMDDEIAMLQLERDKYANIRAGMMDELLSGKKRLI